MRKLVAILIALPILATTALPAVGQAEGAVTLTAPADVEQAQHFEVSTTGPAGPGDLIQIAWPRTPPHTYIRSVEAAADGAVRRLIAPGELGTYELRYYSAATKAVLARQLLQVVPIKIAIEAPERIGMGTPFHVTWRGPAAPKDRIEIVTSGLLSSGAPVDSVELRQDGRPVLLEAPIDTGSYELRYVTGEGKVAASRPIRVDSVSVSLDPARRIVVGEPFEVRWQGPAARRDQIRLFGPDGGADDYLQAAGLWSPDRPVVLTAPTEPGRYRLAYWSGRAKKALEEVSIRVQGAPIEASVEGPRQVEGGSRFEVRWSGPAAPFDEIELARPEMSHGEHLSSALVPPAGFTAELQAPLSPGVYEIRYWSGEGRKVLAQRQIRVSAPAVSLQVHETVRAGRLFTVDWQGPGSRGDEIRISTLSARPNEAELTVMLDTAGQPAEMRAPAEPGTYQLRYWSGAARSILATAILTVQ